MASPRSPVVSLEVEPYDPRWPAAAESAIAELNAALPGLFSAIEHIGSTSVSGLAGKPVIDLMAATASLDAVTVRDADLAALGYERIESGMPNRLLYPRHQYGRWSHHLHVVLEGGWDGRNERLLRDYLRSHPEDALRYATLKRHLASLHAPCGEYTRGKSPLIQALTDRARAARGLPSMPVWEE